MFVNNLLLGIVYAVRLELCASMFANIFGGYNLPRFHISRAFACYSMASGLSSIYQHCFVFEALIGYGVNFKEAFSGEGVFAYTSSEVHHSSFHNVRVIDIIDNYTMIVISNCILLKIVLFLYKKKLVRIIELSI